MSAEPDSPARAIARNVLLVEADAIRALASRLDGAFDATVDRLAACTGRVVVIGVGKSGIVARKIAATLSSTGTPAAFVHAGEALHGDLGAIARGDVVICISQTGETEEIVRLLPVLKQVASCVVSLCGSSTSTLARASDIVLDVGVAAEACPLGLAPTASSTAALAMGDALAMAVSSRRPFSAEDFGRLHPGGSLGQKLMRVSELMTSGGEIPVVHPGMPLRDVIHEMTRKRLGMTTVVEDGRLVGVIGDGDLRRYLEHAEDPLAGVASDVMTRQPRTVASDALALRALELMEAPPRSVMWLVVVGADDAVQGVIHLHDVIRGRR